MADICMLVIFHVIDIKVGLRFQQKCTCYANTSSVHHDSQHLCRLPMFLIAYQLIKCVPNKSVGLSCALTQYQIYLCTEVVGMKGFNFDPLDGWQGQFVIWR
jgi:hypothetical protein